MRLSALWEQRLSSAVSTSLNAEHLTSSGKYKFNYRRVTPSGVVAYDTTAVRQNGDIRADRIDFNVMVSYSVVIGIQKFISTIANVAFLALL